MLAAAGLGAWGLAVWQSEHDVVAAAWAVAGFVLFVAATFFDRVVEITREGVKLQYVQEAFEDAAERTPIAPDDTTDEVKAKVLDQAWYSLYLRSASGETDPYQRAALLQHAWQESHLATTFAKWLDNQGWHVQSEEAGDRFRADLIAIRPAVQIRPGGRPVANRIRAESASRIEFGTCRRRSRRGTTGHRRRVAREWAEALEGANLLLQAAGAPQSAELRSSTSTENRDDH